MTQAERPILVLDGHLTQALASVRSLGRAGFKILVASHQPLPLAGWSRHCALKFRIREESVSAFASLRDWAVNQGVAIVLPLTERSCLLLNAERSDWEKAGVTVGCGPEEMLKNAFDKARTLNRAAAGGIKIPVTKFPTSLNECVAAIAEFGSPCVVKPRWSSYLHEGRFSTSRAPAYLSSSKAAQDIVIRRKQGEHWPLIQEFVPGRGIGIFALCDHGNAVALFAHERLRETRPTGSGSSLRRSISLDPRLREPVERLLCELRWHGPAMFEFKDDGTCPRLMEINGRFWGSLQLAIDAGINFPLMWVKLLKGQPVEQVTKYEENVTLRFLLGDIKRFLRILSGAPKGYEGAFPSVSHGFKELFGSQPPGTRLEAWRSWDPLPMLGELVAGSKEFLGWFKSKLMARKPDEQIFPNRRKMNLRLNS